MEKLPCYIYRDGEHFTLPSKFDDSPPKLCQFAVLDDAGRPAPHPQVFRQVEKPDEAALFLFPWDIGHYVDALMADEMEALIRALPCYPGRELRHIVCDGGDLTHSINIPARLFKISLTPKNAGSAVGTWYDLPFYCANEKASFNRQEIRYDCAFVGNITNPLRKAAILSLQHQCEGLRLKIDLDDSLYLQDGYYFQRERTPEQLAARQRLYLDATRQSLAVLCPPGIGPHSIRMYETMHLGRVPVLFDTGAVYPFADDMDYSAFCLFIPGDRVMDTGSILRKELAARHPEELCEMGVLACKTWNSRFAPEKGLPELLKAASARYDG